MKYLADILYNIIKDLQDGIETGNLLPQEFQEQMLMLYKLVGYTRDIIDGKGEYALGYMQIMVWYDFYPRLAEFLLKCFVSLDNKHPYGSWKDMKYFCNYCKTQSGDENHPFINYAIQFTNEQLAKDISQVDVNKKTLVAKWIPREKQPKFTWLFKKMAHDYFKEYIVTAKTDEQIKRAKNKCEMEYRKIISNINRQLDTTQIKQCEYRWSQIEPSKITTATLFKQRKAFLNITNDKTMRKTTKDRMYCGDNIANYINTLDNDVDTNNDTNNLENSSKCFKKKACRHIYLNEYVKNALELIKTQNQSEIKLLNILWKQNGNENMPLAPMIAMVDTSLSMLINDAYYQALGLGIRVAEKNAFFGKQIMTFGKTSKWHNLEHCDDFVEAVKAVTYDSSTTTKDETYSRVNLDEYSNIYDGFDKLLEIIIDTKMCEKQVAELNIVIFSNMKFIKQPESSGFITVYEAIKQKYDAAGLKAIKKPYKMPHLIFWNLESTHGFPCLSIHPNITMISGNNPKLLNLFCTKSNTSCGYPEYSESPPNNSAYTKMKHMLKNNRYKCLEEEMMKFLL
jgi:hypothetical protein